jgi:hypothetical protein
MERAVVTPLARKRNWSDWGLAVSVALAIPLAMIVEAIGYIMVENSATWSQMAVLGLFAVPLVTGWAAIAIGLSSRPLWVRLSVAALLLLLPPALLFGVWNG